MQLLPDPLEAELAAALGLEHFEDALEAGFGIWGLGFIGFIGFRVQGSASKVAGLRFRAFGNLQKVGNRIKDN